MLTFSGVDVADATNALLTFNAYGDEEHTYRLNGGVWQTFSAALQSNWTAHQLPVLPQLRQGNNTLEFRSTDGRRKIAANIDLLVSTDELQTNTPVPTTLPHGYERADSDEDASAYADANSDQLSDACADSYAVQRAWQTAEAAATTTMQVKRPTRLQNSLSTRAGLPATTERDGTSLVTTLAAPTTASWPIITPGKMVTRLPIQTRSPMSTGRASGTR